MTGDDVKLLQSAIDAWGRINAPGASYAYRGTGASVLGGVPRPSS